MPVEGGSRPCRVGLRAGPTIGSVTRPTAPPTYDATSFAPLVFLSLLGMALGALAYWLYNPIGVFLIVAVVAMGVTLWPVAATPGYDPMSPWTFVLVPVFGGIVLRNVYIAFGLEGSERTLDDLFFRGADPAAFVYPGLILLLALLLVGVAYVGWTPRIDRSRTVAARYEPFEFGPALRWVVVLGALTSLLTFALFVRATGGLDTERLSAKRTTITQIDINRDTDYRGLGVLRTLNTAGGITFLMLLGHLAAQRRRLWFSLHGLVLLALFSNAVLLPLYSSSKGEVLFLIVMAGVVRSYCGDRLPLRAYLSGALALAATLSILTFARNAQNLAAGQVVRAATSGAVFDSIVYNRNMIELPKTAQIINRVPHELPYRNGSTILAYLVAPIPREVWPTKPLIAPGPVIGTSIYDTHRAGVPPGLVAETYWNFGFAAVPFTAIGFGLVLRYLRDKFAIVRGANTAAVVLYAVTVVRLPYLVLGTTIGSGVLSTVLDAGLALLLLRLARGARTVATDSSAAGGPAGRDTVAMQLS